MYMQHLRLKDNGKSTLGMFMVDGEFECFVLEDTHRDVKVDGETRIPAGKYEVKLRNAGGMTSRYKFKYGDMHKGMLWLQDVPGFEWVYIHTGNLAEDTAACLLIGTGCTSGDSQSVTSSVAAYKKLYPRMAEAILSGEEVTISIV